MYPNGTVPTGPGEVHGGRTPPKSLKVIIMKGRTAILFSGLVAILMVTCAVPFMASEDSDALTGNSHISLNYDSAVIYVSGTDNSFTFTADLTNAPAGTTGSNVVWTLNTIGTPAAQVSYNEDVVNVYTTVGISATVYAVSTGSIEVVATLNNDTNYYASAVVVVKQSASAPADEFNFFFQIDSSAYSYVVANCQNLNGTTPNAVLPNNIQMSTFNTGFWVKVKQCDTGLSDADFNAQSALMYYLNTYNWSKDIGAYGWINSLLGLESYMGPEEDGGNIWYYWAQYTLTNNGWTFNNTTMEFITEEGSSYIGLIFWGSPPSMAVPTPAPAYPVP